MVTRHRHEPRRRCNVTTPSLRLRAARHHDALPASGPLLKDDKLLGSEIDVADADARDFAPSKTQLNSDVDHEREISSERDREGIEFSSLDHLSLHRFSNRLLDLAAWRAGDEITIDRRHEDRAECVVLALHSSRHRTRRPLVHQQLNAGLRDCAEALVTDCRIDVQSDRRLVARIRGRTLRGVGFEPQRRPVLEENVATSRIKPGTARLVGLFGGLEFLGLFASPERLRVLVSRGIAKADVVAAIAVTSKPKLDTHRTRARAFVS